MQFREDFGRNFIPGESPGDRVRFREIFLPAGDMACHEGTSKFFDLCMAACSRVFSV